MNKPIDQQSRELIVKELDKNLLVEAGAGSGKTTSLVERMVQVIRQGKFKVHEIAAITFTRKAALEMEERFQTVLEKELRTCVDMEVRMRLEEALRDINTAYIGTVHAFCGRLLRERPVEAGIDPEFKEAEESGDAIHAQQAWMEYTTQVNGRFPDLEKIGIDPGDLQGAYKEMCKYPDVEWMTEEIEKPDFSFEKGEVLIFLNRVRDGIPSTQITDKDYDDLQKAILRALRMCDHNSLEEDCEIVGFLSLFNKEFKIVQNRWLSKEDGKYAKEEADVLYEDTIAPVMKDWQVYCHYHLTNFLKGAVKYYEDYRTRNSCLNFQDLLMKTASLLKNNSEVRKYFQGKYKTLVVDEFQDTDPIQAEIIFYLTGMDIKEKDWQKLVPRPGSLFVVGDPKQSIYRFMRADIDTYNLVKKLITENGGEVVSLTTNFRSTKSIGDYLNPIFEKAFKGMLHQADYAPIDSFNEDKDGSNFGVRCLSIPVEYSKGIDVIRYEAEAIAKIIRNAVDGGMKLSRNGSDIIEIPTYRDFLILSKNRFNMEVYAKALEEQGVPVRMTGNSIIGDSVELKELLNLLKCLLRTDDQIYLGAVLKGLFFGVSDNCLYEFKCSGGIFNIFSKVPATLREVYRVEVDQAFCKLRRYYRWSRKYSPSVVVEKIVDDLGLVEFSSMQEMSKSRVGVIYDVLERLLIEESSGVTEFKGIVERLEAIVEAGLEEELDIYISENRVRIMNLHKAKGLEASVVFLVNPKNDSKHAASYYIKREDSVAKGYFTYAKSPRKEEKSRLSWGGGSSIVGIPFGWEAYCKVEETYLEAEALRLVYVAATRAKNLLFVSHSCKDNKRNPWGLLVESVLKGSVVEVPEISPSSIVNSGVCSVEDFVVKKDLDRVREVNDSWSKALVGSSYGQSSPTAIKDGELLWSIPRIEGGGRDRGSALHYVLEQLVNGIGDGGVIDETALISQALVDFELASVCREEFVGIVERFKESDLWKRLNGAFERFVEVPFSIKIQEGHRLYDLYRGDANVPIILTGVIDLIFKEADGWVVVDYKSDRLFRDEDYQLLNIAYLSQLESYAVIFSELTGERVKGQELVFLERL